MQKLIKSSVISGLASVMLCQTGLAADNKLPTAGYEKGKFFIQSSDGANIFVPTYTLQFQNKVELQNSTLVTNTFLLRRARLQFAGSLFSKDLLYEVDSELKTPKPDHVEFSLKDFFAEYKFFDELRARIGQYKVPFGNQYMISGKKLQFVERSLATGEFIADRDIGLEFWGKVDSDRYRYYAGIFNGAGSNRLNNNTDLLYALRLETRPLRTFKDQESDLEGSFKPRLTLGIESFLNKTEQNDRQMTFGVFSSFKFAGLSLQGEYFNRLNMNGLNSAAQGYYAQLGYFILPKNLEAALRVSQVFKGNGYLKQEYGTVFNYFFTGQNLKFQLDYTALLDNQKQDDQLTHRILGQFQLYF